MSQKREELRATASFCVCNVFLWKANPTNKLKEKEETPQNVDTTLAKQRKLRKISWYQS